MASSTGCLKGEHPVELDGPCRVCPATSKACDVFELHPDDKKNCLDFCGFLNTTSPPMNSSSDNYMDVLLPLTVGIAALAIIIIIVIIVKWHRRARREARGGRTKKISKWCSILVQKSISIFRRNDDTAIEHQDQSENENLNPVPNDDGIHLRNVDETPDDINKIVDDNVLEIV